MSLPVDRLTKESKHQAIQQAISDTIEYLMKHEGKSQKQAAGEAYGIAEQKLGHKI
jgi:hypothetical protein